MLELAALTEDLVDEIFLRLPPNNPASLIRAALVCKRWHRHITSADFRRSFRQFHCHTPPTLGFLRNQTNQGASAVDETEERFVSCFVPTPSFSSSCPYITTRRFVPRSSGSWRRLVGWRTIDARHGHVLLHSYPWGLIQKMVVRDPITDEHAELPMLPQDPDPYHWGWNAAVIGAMGDDGCDHLDCHRGPFRVVFVGCSLGIGMFTRVYSSESGAGSELASSEHYIYGCLSLEPCVLVRNTFYFKFLISRNEILTYDLSSREICRIQLPRTVDLKKFAFIPSEGFGLGLARVKHSKLYLWSKESGQDGRWARSRVIELETLLPVDALSTKPRVLGFVEVIGVIILQAGNGIFGINPESGQVMKIEDTREEGGTIDNVVPYICSYTPQFGYNFAY